MCCLECRGEGCPGMAGSTQQAHQQRCERVAPRQDISQHQLKKNAKTQMHLRQQLRGLTKNISHPKRPQPAAAGTGPEPASPLGPRCSRGPGSPRSREGSWGNLHRTRCVFTSRTRWHEKGAGRRVGNHGPRCGDGERWGASRRIYERRLSQHDALGASSHKRRAS